MMTIHRYVLNPVDETVQMPVGAEVLSAAVKDGDICIWALVDDAVRLEPRKVYVVPTGARFPQNLQHGEHRFIGTVQLPDQHLGTLVFHIFVNA